MGRRGEGRGGEVLISVVARDEELLAERDVGSSVGLNAEPVSQSLACSESPTAPEHQTLE